MTYLDRIYQLDKAMAQLCKEMQVNGFAFDEAKAQELATFFRNKENNHRVDITNLVQREAPAFYSRQEKRNKKGKITAQFNPMSTTQIGALFFEEWGHPVWAQTETGSPALDLEAKLQYIKLSEDPRVVQICRELSQLQNARKMRTTYIENLPRRAGRVHVAWKNYGAVSGRFASRLMQLPRKGNDVSHHLGGGIRSLFYAPPGRKLVYFDAAQLELRVAAYVSQDPSYIHAVESSDAHAANATMVFGPAFTGGDQDTKSRLRSISKTFIFAINYMAGSPTVHQQLVEQGFDIPLLAVEKMIKTLRAKYTVFFRYVDNNIKKCIKTGYVYSPLLGRRRYLGHDPIPTEVANFPIQSGAADLVNLKLAQIAPAVKQLDPTALFLAQVHDSATFEVKENLAEKIGQACKAHFEDPILINGIPRSFPVDLKIVDNWSQC